ncbi:hypothetical protein ymoll0001_20060 [Yersinia mollaretii ATCC 43969]|uniref:Uncharacterized protein n=1 Tax=Yersinia mollaretii (strain ATCC 43969 / DSM 18520 / CIP 103324 / CNY 7263 / WAIP 204) TaxID=349967 RepID=A0ABM9YBY9_YERMW|nr:hypothetical protein ymoll0001_20060 [Yersinia mollaretii ATCC 43969]
MSWTRLTSASLPIRSAGGSGHWMNDLLMDEERAVALLAE